MYDYLEDILAEMPDDMNGTPPTPASEVCWGFNLYWVPGASFLW
jgi:hypothetical protein